MDRKGSIKNKPKFNRITPNRKSTFDKKNILYLYTTLVLFFLNVVFLIVIILISKTLPPQVPLYYGLPRGEEQLVSPISLVLPIILSLLFIILNNIIAYFTEILFLKKVLIFGSYFVSLLSIVTIVNIIFLI